MHNICIMESAATHKNPGFTIREPRRGDFKDIISNYYARYSEAKRNPSLGLHLLRKKPPRKDEIEWCNALLRGMKKGTHIAFVAEADGKVVGMCDVVPVNPYLEKRHIGRLGISIKEGYRSRGIGTALMQKTLARSRRRYEMIILELFSINKHALNLYKKSGFKQYGMLPNGYARGKRRIGEIMMYLKA